MSKIELDNLREEVRQLWHPRLPSYMKGPLAARLRAEEDPTYAGKQERFAMALSVACFLAGVGLLIAWAV